MLLLWDALGHPTGREEDFAVGVPEPMPGVEPEMSAAFQKAVASLRKASIPSRPVDISSVLIKLADAQHTISFYEAARFHQQRFNQYGDRLGYLATLVREGLQISEAHYDEATRFVAASRLRLTEMYKATPVILVPAATGPAPLGLTYTGDGRMNSPWSALGTPAISIPMPVSDGLPLGLQLTADHGEDARLLRTSVRLHRILHGK